MLIRVYLCVCVCVCVCVLQYRLHVRNGRRRTARCLQPERLKHELRPLRYAAASRLSMTAVSAMSRLAQHRTCTCIAFPSGCSPLSPT